MDMKNINLIITTFALALFALPLSAKEEEKIRVACVGDSITYGAAVKDRKTNCYPAVLGRLLGDTYEVRNFGVNGATLLKKGDKPYWKQGAFKKATAFKPDIVVIKLGTNDTKPQNWKHKADFEADCRALVRHFKKLPSKPKVYLALPVEVIKARWGINRPAVVEQQPIIKKVAKSEKIEVIDLFKAIADPKLFAGDGIHPNKAGAKKIAEVVHGVLTSKK